MHRAGVGRRAGVLVLVGTRPEAVKLAPVVQALRREPGLVSTWLVSTGQHADLATSALQAFGLHPDRDLRIMRPGQDLFHIAGAILAGLRPLLDELKPELALVQGDTATVLFGALSAFFGRVAVGHVEAGLRSGDKWQPYPEELFRQMTSLLADLHFPPTWGARDRLLAEGVPQARIFVTGNTSVDAVQLMRRTGAMPPSPAARRLTTGDRRLVLVTAHRRESFGAPLRRIFGAVRDLADRHHDTLFVVPVHPNPAVRQAAEALAGHPRVLTSPPLDYPDLLHLLAHATLVLTDSGGIQEEAPSLGAPVLVLRQVTERPEGLGTVAELVGTDPGRIAAAADRLLSDENARQAMVRHPNPYGDGQAGLRIADIVIHHLTGRARRTSDWEGIEPLLPWALAESGAVLSPGED